MKVYLMKGESFGSTLMQLRDTNLSIFLKVLHFEIGTGNIAFVLLEELLIQLK